MGREAGENHVCFPKISIEKENKTVGGREKKFMMAVKNTNVLRFLYFSVPFSMNELSSRDFPTGWCEQVWWFI